MAQRKIRATMLASWLLAGSGATSASAQPVTLADLDGATIEASVVRHDVRRPLDGRFAGQEISGRVQQDWRIVLGPGDRIRSNVRVASESPQGTRTGSWSGSGTVGRPGRSPTLGGRHLVAIFGASTLTTLVAYDAGGGFKQSIAFTRSGGAIGCAIRVAFARETGAAGIRYRSPITGDMIQLISSKQISSSCRVTRPGA